MDENNENNENKLNLFIKQYGGAVIGGLIALILFVLGIIIGIPVIVEFLKTSYITKVPSAILATGIISLSAISMPFLASSV